ncbi:hypothetical protein C5167_010205 [Papaver somniferum]|uniref:Uncharacterized protein n=1 Tax=Papaver somniferum TaxID=3469 RepID=A0A4Y7K3G7_PAPSO|nr:hypothetical protein C5167_010205 [Papaver somniferum]
MRQTRLRVASFEKFGRLENTKEHLLQQQQEKGDVDDSGVMIRWWANTQMASSGLINSVLVENFSFYASKVSLLHVDEDSGCRVGEIGDE